MWNFIMEWCTNYLGFPSKCEKFEHKLSNYLKHYRTAAVTGKQFHWDAICSFVRLHINELYEKENASIFCNYVIELLLEFDCPSKFFVSRIIDIYCICNCGPFFGPESPSIAKISENQRLPFLLEFLKSRFSENTIDSFYDQCRDDYVYTLKGIKKGNMKFMRLLVKYDCTTSWPLFYYPDIYENSLLDIIDKFGWKIRTVTPGIFPFRFPTAAHFVDGWRTVSWPGFVGPKPSFDRMTLIMKGVDAMLGKLLRKEENSENLDCFRLYVESTSYPLLTLREFRGFLIALSWSLRLDGVFNEDRICDAFSEAYPECDAFYHQPRTLRHLCRCGVRRCYRKYGSLPVTLEKLHVPTILKNYILCQKDKKKNEEDMDFSNK